jgi:hypothetical protein
MRTGLPNDYHRVVMVVPIRAVPMAVMMNGNPTAYGFIHPLFAYIGRR